MDAQSKNTPSKDTTQPRIDSMMNIEGIVNELWKRTANQLTPSELEWFACAADSALVAMQNIEDVLNGIAMLVSSDGPGEGHIRAGSFQSARDCSILLFFLAESMCHVRAMVAVSDEASHRLRKPDLYR